MIDKGVVHGRFQIFHLDHLKYVMAASNRCEHLIVGITNPDPTLTRSDPADLNRSSPEANPLTYFERYIIIRAVLSESGLEERNFSVVPFPINFPELYSSYVPLDAMFFLTIYDDWGRRKMEIFQSLRLRTSVLWERPPEQKGIRASEIRKRISTGKQWEEFVPKATSRLLKEMKILDRLRETRQL